MMLYLLSFIFLLLPFTELKVINIKVYEFFYLLIITIFVVSRRNSISTTKYYNKYLVMLHLFIMSVLLTSISSFGGKFYIPSSVMGLLNKPIIITFARMIQIVIAVYISFFVYYIISKNKKYFIKGIYYYLIVGAFVCCLGLISLITNSILGEDLLFGAYNGRIRGTFIEGGPFGIYVVSLILMTNLYFSLTEKSMNWKLVCLAFFGIIIVLTQSKAAFLLLIVLYIISLFVSQKNRLIKLCLIGIFMLGSIGFIGNGLQGYYHDYQNAEQILKTERKTDNNFVMGRIAASHIVPNMIQDNPINGIGLGNYPLVRNNPEYRKSFPAVANWDLTGLGLVDVIVEVGIPIALFFIVILSLPFYLCFKLKLDINISRIALFQLLAHCFGVQVTFIYPWIVTAFVFAYMRIYPGEINQELVPREIILKEGGMK